MNTESTWRTVSAAAKILHVSQQAIRKRLIRGTINSRMNNQGVVMVEVEVPLPEWHSSEQESGAQLRMVAVISGTVVSMRGLERFQ
ncbi:MAG: hypothetical protein WCK65_14240, partial [Rhodospirillaceae bacterium]